MNKQRLYLYVLYGLLLGGIAGKLIGWITLTHNIFFDWIAEGMICVFLLLEVKSLFSFFNPGVEVKGRLQANSHIYNVETNQGWLFVGVFIRALGIFFLSIAAFLFFTAFRHVEYVWGGICIYGALLLLLGIISYVKDNPYVMLLDEEGIIIYLFSFRKISWDKLEEVRTRAEWIALKPQSGAVKEVEFENLNATPQDIVTQVRAQALIRNISYHDSSGQFTPELWE